MSERYNVTSIVAAFGYPEQLADIPNFATRQDARASLPGLDEETIFTSLNAIEYGEGRGVFMAGLILYGDEITRAFHRKEGKRLEALMQWEEEHDEKAH